MPTRAFILVVASHAALAGGGAVFLASCAAPQSTSLTTDDLRTTASEMAEELRTSSLMQNRGPDSPRIVVAITKVENLTSDLIPVGEQWWMMTKVRDSQPIAQLRQDKNIYFVIPQEHLREGMDRGNFPEGFAGSRSPTHEMTASFHSARRAAALDRTDAYLCEYRMTELATGEQVWTDTVSFKRVAVGRWYD